MERYDAVVIGAGFYGCCIAIHLLRRHGMSRVCLIDGENGIMRRASLVNQARIHQGHHYPRDFVTANRSRASFPRFAERHRRAVFDGYEAIYAIAARNSHISARGFLGMMRSIGAVCEPASHRRAALFDPNRIEAVFRVQEFAFDATVLAEEMMDDLDAAGVVLRTGTKVTSAERNSEGWTLSLEEAGGASSAVSADRIVECTYGRTGEIPGTPPLRHGVRLELCEVCLVEPPGVLKDVGVTVMDGPFFSCMPYPSAGLHSLTHVRWTPRGAWISHGGSGQDPYARLADVQGETRFEDMRMDAARLLPAMRDARHDRSLFEVKAVLQAHERNDGRPILVEGDLARGGMLRVLGGKMDNIYDVLETIDGMGRKEAP